MKLENIYIRDPFLLKDDNTYYLYGTTDQQAWGGIADGFKVYISKNLIDFEEKYVFKNDGFFWANENYWAPEVHKLNGKFYMFASFIKNGMHRRSQVLISNRPDEMFTPLNNPLTLENQNCLDATFFVENGKKYTIYCHEWTQIGNGEICASELDENMNLKGEIKTLFNAKSAPWVRPIKEGCYITDGPYIKKMKNGKLLMLWSSNGEKGYSMGMSVSDSIFGKWTHISEPLISCNGGHGMIFEDKGKLFIIYHYPNEPHMKERACIREAEEKDGILFLKNN